MLDPGIAEPLRRALRTLRRSVYCSYFAARRRIADRETMLPHKILVGTHHKTGTVWLQRVFDRICVELGLSFYSGPQHALPSGTDVFFNNHSLFDTSTVGAFRCLHMIRDPRDRIISGCFYHQTSTEQWLHQRRAEFGGLSYQEKLNSYASFDDKLLFEMEHTGRNGIEEMLAWDYDDRNVIDVKYEDLIRDKELELFHTIFTFLGFGGADIPTLLRIAYRNSLFSGQLRQTSHIRSGRSSQWIDHFKLMHSMRFVELFPDALIKLGYEQNDDWVQRHAVQKRVPIQHRSHHP